MNVARLLRSASVVTTPNNCLKPARKVDVPVTWKIKWKLMLYKWGEYWKNLYLDYQGVAVDVAQDAKKKPLKAVVISSCLGLMYAAIKTNPDKQSFHDNLVDSISDMMFVSKAIRNPVSESHLKFLTTCENQKLLRHFNLIFFSVIMTDDYNSECKLYAAQCTYLRPKYITFYERIVDIGAYGMWFNLWWKMRNYDVNEEEWKSTG